MRFDRQQAAQMSLAAVELQDLTAEERSSLAEELAQTSQLVFGADAPSIPTID